MEGSDPRVDPPKRRKKEPPESDYQWYFLRTNTVDQDQQTIDDVILFAHLIPICQYHRLNSALKVFLYMVYLIRITFSLLRELKFAFFHMGC